MICSTDIYYPTHLLKYHDFPLKMLHIKKLKPFVTILNVHFVLRFLAVGLVNICLTPPACWVWNFKLFVLSICHGESNDVVSWSTKCVYLVLPDLPKFFTCMALGKIVLSKWSSRVGMEKSRLYTSSSSF